VLCDAECLYAKSCYAEFLRLTVFMLSVFMLSVLVMSAIAEYISQNPNQSISTFLMPLTIEGATDKLLQVKMPLKSFPSKKYVYTNKNVFLKTAQRLKQQTCLKLHYFCLFLNGSVYIFRPAIHVPFIVLSKDGLFHFGLIYIGKAFSSIELTRVEPMTKLRRSFQAFPANIRLVRM
jgi:hypothetical protein